jgi:hypothetical protein
MRRSNRVPVHYWGKIRGCRKVAPCGKEREKDLCTGVLGRLTCKECIKIVKEEKLH